MFHNLHYYCNIMFHNVNRKVKNITEKDIGDFRKNRGITKENNIALTGCGNGSMISFNDVNRFTIYIRILRNAVLCRVPQCGMSV